MNTLYRTSGRRSYGLPAISIITLIAVLAILAGQLTERFGPKDRFCTVSPEKAGLDAVRLRQADSIIMQAIADGEMPGAVLAVVRHGKLAYLQAYGNRSVYPDTIPMTVNTVFDLASVSKCVSTTTAVMQQIEAGRIRLNDPVWRYIPGFRPWTDPETGDTASIQIRHLLTHSSGIDAYVSVPSYVKRYGSGTPDSLIRHIARECGRQFRPGTGLNYSCLNFVTLQHIVEQVSGQPLHEYAAEHIFGPLGMQSTGYAPDGNLPEEIRQRCAPTEIQPDGSVLLGAVHDPIARIINRGISGNAGVFSTAEDLARFCAALMNGGSVDGKRILSPATIRTMARVPDFLTPSTGRALGWDNRSGSASIKGDLLSSDRTICHTGYTGTSLVIDLENECAVILLAHRVHPRDKGSLTRLRATVSNAVAGSFTE